MIISWIEEFCIQNTIQWAQREKLLRVYGNEIFNALYNGVFHEPVKKIRGDLHQNSKLKPDILWTYIYNLYQEDAFKILSSKFKAVADGIDIEAFPLLNANLDEKIAQIMNWKQEIILCFTLDPSFKGIQKIIADHIRADHIFSGKELDHIPTSFTVTLNRQEDDMFQVTDSIFTI